MSTSICFTPDGLPGYADVLTEDWNPYPEAPGDSLEDFAEQHEEELSRIGRGYLELWSDIDGPYGEGDVLARLRVGGRDE